MNLYIKSTLLLLCFICCNSQVKNKPESISEKLNAGFLAIKNGDTTLAEQKANEAYLMDSTNANALALISEVYKKKKRYKESLEYINKAIKRNNKVALFYASRSLINSNIYGLDSALNDMVIAFNMDSSSLEIINNMASIYSNMDKYKEAVLYLDKYIKINPNDYNIYYSKAVCFSYLNDYKNAIESCNRAIELNQNDGHIYKLRADCYINLNRYESACDDLSQSMELLRNDEEVKKALRIYCK